MHARIAVSGIYWITAELRSVELHEWAATKNEEPSEFYARIMEKKQGIIVLEAPKRVHQNWLVTRDNVEKVVKLLMVEQKGS